MKTTVNSLILENEESMAMVLYDKDGKELRRIATWQAGKPSADGKHEGGRIIIGKEWLEKAFIDFDIVRDAVRKINKEKKVRP